MKRTERNPFLYADKGEQIKRINKSLIFVYSIFYIFFAWVMILSKWIEQRSTTVVVAFVAACIVALSIDIVAYLKNKSSNKLRVIAFISLFLISIWAGLVFSATYLKFMTLIPLVICIFYYDTKFTMYSVLCMAVLYQGIAVIRAFVLKNLESGEMMDAFCTSMVIILLLSVIVITEKIAKQFNEDALGKVESEKEIQAKMLDDVILVASEVRKGTQSAMEMVNGLSDSSEIVYNVMTDIFQSTQSTAEGIETQNVMTQNIQETIESTLQYSEIMVEAANKSMECNRNNMQIMQRLQSEQ